MQGGGSLKKEKRKEKPKKKKEKSQKKKKVGIVNYTLKACSQISNKGCSPKCQNLNFLHLFIALPVKRHFSKGIGQKSFQC